MQRVSSEASRIGWLDTARRLQRVGFVLAKHGFGEVVARIGVMAPRLPMSAPPPPLSSRERLAQRLSDVLTELGPTYVKLGQLLATRADLFPPEVVRVLSSLHASVRPISGKLVVRTVEEELGASLPRLFAQFEEKQLAAASIGQVHRAVLHDGTKVVVKVQRPGIRAQIEADLVIMRSLAQLLAQHVPEVAEYDPAALVEAFARSIAQELDFRVEADNAHRLQVALAGASEAYVPTVYQRLTTERVLVMEYVEGTRLSELPRAARSRAHGSLLRVFVRQVVEHGVFHGDPHPGNLLVLDDGRVALLDFGTIDVLDRTLKDGLFRLGLALALRRRETLSQCVVSLSNTPDARAVDRARLRDDIDSLLKAASSDGSAVLAQVLAMSRAHALRLPPALLALSRALAILDGVLRSLDPSRDLVRDLRREFALSSVRRVGRAVGQRARRLAATTTHAARRALYALNFALHGRR